MFFGIYQQKWLYYVIFIILNNWDFTYGGSDTCDDLPHINNTIPIVNENPPFPIGKNLKFDCKYGYYDSGIKSTAVCVAKNNSGVWNYTNNCKAVSCDSPGEVENGQRIGDSFVYPKNVTYVCNEGYKIKGRATIFCGTDGSWTASPPKCLIISCPRPQNPANGTASFSSITYGSEVIFTCHKGFYLNGPIKRRCEKTEVWSDVEPTCLAINCPDPEPIPGGYFVKLTSTKNYGENFVIIYYCNKTQTTQQTVRCLNGIWRPSPPQCEVGPPITVTTKPTEDTSTVKQVDSTVINGTLRPTEIPKEVSTIKQVGECFDVAKIKHGSYEKESDNTVTYKCEKGYKINGPKTLKCLPSGKWDMKAPTCERGLPIGYILGIVFGITALIASIVGVSLYFLKRRKSQSPVKPSKASLNDAVNIEELQKLEKNHRPIPVTVL